MPLWQDDRAWTALRHSCWPPEPRLLSMKIIAMLSFYDEDPALVAACIASVTEVGATHLVAVDGAYRLFPDGRPVSAWRTIDAVSSCTSVGLGLLLYSPTVTWINNEVGKRSVMLGLAMAIAEPGDWLMVVDSDYIFERYVNLHDLLSRVDEDVVEVGFYDARHPDGLPLIYEASLIMRAVPGLRMGDNHYTYISPSGRENTILRAGGGDAASYDATDTILVRHDVHQRDPERRARQTKYYEQRDQLGIEK